MKFYKKLLLGGVIALESLLMTGCANKGEPMYISGKVEGKSVEKIWPGRDYYNFSMSTKEGLKFFKCGDSPSKLNAIISEGDSVNIELDQGYGRDPEDSEFYVNIWEIKKINGKLNPIRSWGIE